MKWVETKGRKPKTNQPLLVQFRNGVTSTQAYTVSQLRWTHTSDDEWDVVAVARP